MESDGYFGAPRQESICKPVAAWSGMGAFRAILVGRMVRGRFGVVRIGVVRVLWSRLAVDAAFVRSGLLATAAIEPISEQATVGGHQVHWHHQASC